MPDDKLSRLTARRNELNAQIRREQNREKTKHRKDDTRRKILAGAAILHKASGDKQYEKWLIHNLLDGFLTKPDDRALFGLSPLPEEQNKTVGEK